MREQENQIEQQENQGEQVQPLSRKAWRHYGDDGATLDRDEIVDTKVFPAGVNPCRITFWGSTKINAGNYENVEIGMSLSVPCLHEEIEGAKEFTKAKINEWLTKEITEIRAELHGDEE